MNRYSWIAVGLLLVVGVAVFGVYWTLPDTEQYMPQEKRVVSGIGNEE